MKIKQLIHVFMLAFAGLVSAQATAASFYYDYTANVAPDDPSLQNIFSTGLSFGTSWSASGGVLTMNTAADSGLWFGNHPTSDQVPWQLADDSLGNYASLTARLGANSGEWSFYMIDGSYGGMYRFYPGKVTLSGASDYNIDTTTYHTYSMLVRGGNVVYQIDGDPVYSGPASSNSYNGLLVGDGGSGGYGTLYVKDLTVQTAVPVPAAVWLFASGISGLFAFAKRARRGKG